MPVRTPPVFEAEVSPADFTFHEWRMTVGLDPHTLSGTFRVQNGGALPRASSSI